MSVYTQLEADNKADRECIAQCQGIALALKGEQHISEWGLSQLQTIIENCELRLKGDRRLGNDILMVRYGDVKEWK